MVNAYRLLDGLRAVGCDVEYRYDDDGVYRIRCRNDAGVEVLVGSFNDDGYVVSQDGHDSQPFVWCTTADGRVRCTYLDEVLTVISATLGKRDDQQSLGGA